MNACLVDSLGRLLSGSILENAYDGVCLLAIVHMTLHDLWLGSPYLDHEDHGCLPEVVVEVACSKLAHLNAHIHDHAQSAGLDERILALGCGC